MSVPTHLPQLLRQLAVAIHPGFSDATEAWALWPDQPVVPPAVRDGHLTDVTTAALVRFAAKPNVPFRGSLVICPGGGYQVLALSHEGHDIAKWANGLGYDAYVLIYRCPCLHPGPLSDALRAIRMVRHYAATHRGSQAEPVGICGFSAGGHLAGSATTLWSASTDDDLAPEFSARPDFAILVYPVISLVNPAGHFQSGQNLLGPDAAPADQRALSLETRVQDHADAPPLLLVHGLNDVVVHPENSILLWQAYRKINRPVELLLYANGPHGIGAKPGHGPISNWPDRAAEWLLHHIPNAPSPM